MHVLVDLNRCQSYGQCVYAAPDVFTLRDEEVLEWDYSPAQDRRAGLEQAVHACPVQAITVSAPRTER